MDNNTMISLLKQTLKLSEFNNNPTICMAFENAFNKIRNYDELQKENELLKEKIKEYESILKENEDEFELD